MTNAISHTDAVGFAGELAELLLQNDANQADAAHLQREAARESFLELAQSQVDALKDAASATLTGAFVSAAFAAAGGACTMIGAVEQFKAETAAAGLSPADFSCDAVATRQIVADWKEAATLWNAVGKTSSDLAGPSNGIAQSVAENYQAEAKRWEALGAQAQWQASDASAEINQVEKQASELLDALQGIQRDQNSSANSIIGRI